MNREIKFRAWDKNAKIMRDDGTHPDGKAHMKYDVGILPSCARNKWATGVDGLEIRLDSEDFIVMQFTGLKDKNGKEIYEGDIIKADNSKHKCKVSWSEKYASFVLTREDWTFRHYFGEACDPEDCEVIGNIYENHELLKP